MATIQVSASFTVVNSKRLADNTKTELLNTMPELTLELKDGDKVVFSAPASPRLSSNGSVMVGCYGKGELVQ
jgi:hypothetical protein